MSDREADLAGRVGLVVSQDNSCRYCYAGARALLNLMGVDDQRIRKLEHPLRPPAAIRGSSRRGP